MPLRRLVTTALLLAAAGLTGCTSESASPQAAPTTTAPPSTASPEPSGPTPAPDEAEIPVAHDAGYTDAVATFGEEQVRGALADDARIARIALADCLRWRTGTVDPELTALVSPALMTRVQQELDGPAGTVPSLLSHLPTDDGNGNNEAAAVVQGCDDSAPLETGPGPEPAVRVDHSGAQPRLVLDAAFTMVVVLGDTRVSAGQDWTFTSTPTATGWQLTDATAEANVDWAPASA